MGASYRIVWTDYLRWRTERRGFDLDEVEHIVRFSTERYFDDLTGRAIVIGRHHGTLVVIPYETEADVIKPVTIHATTRQQISFRVRTGRFRHG